jgi:hypothetical protein
VQNCKYLTWVYYEEYKMKYNVYNNGSKNKLSREAGVVKDLAVVGCDFGGVKAHPIPSHSDTVAPGMDL